MGDQARELETADPVAREAIKQELLLELGRQRADLNADFDARTAGLEQKVQDTMHIPMVQRVGIIETDVAGVQNGVREPADQKESFKKLIEEAGDRLMSLTSQLYQLQENVT